MKSVTSAVAAFLALFSILFSGTLRSEIIYQDQALSLKAYDDLVTGRLMPRNTSDYIENLKDSLTLSEVGVADIHTISFNQLDSVVVPGGSFLVTFPEGFQTGGLFSATYGDNDEGNIDFAIDSASINGQTYQLFLDTLGTTPYLGSQIRLIFPDLINSSVAGDYQIALAVLDSTGRLITGPTVSQEFTLEPGPLDSFAISPGTNQQIQAGEMIQFSAVCFDSLENSLDCDVEWSMGEYKGGVLTEDGLFLGRFRGLTWIRYQLDMILDSVGVFVFAGDFDRIHMTVEQEQVVAGKQLSDSVLIRIFDRYDNTIEKYFGQAWFESSDPLAELYYNPTFRYQFLVDDQGQRRFPGEQFVFNTAGVQKLYVVSSDDGRDTAYIEVLPDLAADFNTIWPDSVRAGQQFNISVSNLRDASGNLLEGVMQVSLAGDGTAPDGSAPSINPITIANGNGTAVQKLVASEQVSFNLQYDTISRTIGPIKVAGSPAESFDFELATPQVVGSPFGGTAQLTALDQYGNVALDFDASLDTVVISALGNGSIVNDSIYAEDAFENGICDLTRFDIAYSGPDRFLKFKAVSKSGVEGTSETIEFTSTAIERISLSSEALYRGDQFVATVTLANYGSLNMALDGLTLETTQGSLIIDSIRPELPDTIGGNSSRSYDLYSTLPFTWANQMTLFKASYTGFYDQQAVSGESGFLDSLRVLSQQEATYVEGSLNLQRLTRGRDYDFNLQLKNLGENVISLNTESFLSLSDGTHTVNAQLDVPTFLPTSGEAVNLFFEALSVPTGFESGKYQLYLTLSGLQGSSAYSETLALTDSVTVQTPPEFEYLAGSLAPIEIFRGAPAEFELTLQNNGQASLILSRDDSYLELSSAGRKVRFVPAVEDDTLNTGQNLLVFEPDRVPTDFPSGDNSLSLVLEGIANHRIENFQLELGDNLVDILEGGAVQIAGMRNDARNAPYVNTGQTFSVYVLLANLGSEVLTDVWVRLSAGQSQVTTDSVLLESLDVNAIDSVRIWLDGAEQPVAVEILRAEIVRATGQTTGEPASVISSENNSLVITVQSPALIDPDLRISSPADALDGVMGTRQEFVLTAEFNNLGQAEADLGMAELYLPSGFTSDDDLTVVFEVGTPLRWDVVCPDNAQVSELIVDIVSTPDDLNTEQTALVTKQADTLAVEVREELPTAVFRHSFGAYDLVYPGQTLEVMEVRLTTREGRDNARAVLTDMTFEFADRTGAIDIEGQFLSGIIDFDGESYEAVFEGNRMSFNFGTDVIFSEEDEALLDLRLVVSNQATLENFAISTDTSLIKTYDYTFGNVGNRLRLTGYDGQPLAVEKSYGAVPDDFENSFYNFPNPFDPETETTSIVYFLPIESDVKFDIYTLTGESVYSLAIPAGSSGALGGRINQFYWEGVNGDGVRVLEGVYIAVLKYSGGEARTKIAVVK
ncbi:MAG: hypothetical protein GF404_11725 [candidate division Zixibacteria bacterium]|nr:hypothetical protein [candidate division Zixibacteria bacterium]